MSLLAFSLSENWSPAGLRAEELMTVSLCFSAEELMTVGLCFSGPL